MIAFPPSFAERMCRQLGGGADAFFAAMEQPPVRGLRVHPWKMPEKPLESLIEGLEEAVPWAADGRYLAPDSAAGAHPLHACGAYYIQEPSAMLPAELLKARPGETTLDLCAAPGGKSTQLAAAMDGQGTLVCNEIVPSRAGALSGNLERMGVKNAVVVSADPDILSQKWPRLFDSVLVDAPCSGEGMFRRRPETRLEWDAGAPARCAKRQLRILESAAKMLKAGGRLCYSTCTFSIEENEGVIDDFLLAHPEFCPVEFTVPAGSRYKLSSQSGRLRLYPHEVRGEGHFAALLMKTELRQGEERPASLLHAERVFSPPDRQVIDSYRALWKELSAKEPPEANAAFGGMLVSAPSLPPLEGLKALRIGLSLGRQKGRVFIPDHALSLASPPPGIRSIPLDETAAAAYLRGETIPGGNAAGGFWTVSYENLPLGFVKCSDNQFKNHYPKGLRRP